MSLLKVSGSLVETEGETKAVPATPARAPTVASMGRVRFAAATMVLFLASMTSRANRTPPGVTA